MDQLAQILTALAAVLAASSGLIFHNRGRNKELGDRAKIAEADAYRRLLLLRKIGISMSARGVHTNPEVADLYKEIDQETTQ